MFFTNISATLLLVSVVASVSAAPLGRARRAQETHTVTETVVARAATPTSAPLIKVKKAGRPYVTIISSADGGPAYTLAPPVATTVIGKSTYTIVAPSKPTGSSDPSVKDDVEPSTPVKDDVDPAPTDAPTDAPVKDAEPTPVKDDAEPAVTDAVVKRWIPRGGNQARAMIKERAWVTIVSAVGGKAITIASAQATGTTTTKLGGTIYTVQTAPTGVSKPDTDDKDDAAPTPTSTDAISTATAAPAGDDKEEPVESATGTAPDATATPTVDNKEEATTVEPEVKPETPVADGVMDAISNAVDVERRVYVLRGGNAARNVIRAAKNSASPSADGLLVRSILTVATGSIIGALFML